MPKLNEKDLFEIEKLVKEKRRELNVGMGPIGNNIFKLARQLKIKLVFLPIKNTNDSSNEFSALYLVSKEANKNIVFIGLNTFLRFDRQIFSIAHELYHHWTDTTLFVCHSEDEKSELVELKANRFAAEFLLPTDTLFEEIGKKNNGKKDVLNLSDRGLLRFIALLHCDYRLPYKAIVKRLEEINAISKEQSIFLNKEEYRNGNSTYYKIGLFQDKDVFEKLNTRTKNYGIDGDNIDSMISLLEMGKITVEELSKDLSIFNKRLLDFDLEEEVDITDLDELNGFMKDFENES